LGALYALRHVPNVYAIHPRPNSFFIDRSFVDKNVLPNTYSSKKLLTTILTIADIAKIPPKIILFSKVGF
jgi:hypothetical protein